LEDYLKRISLIAFAVVGAGVANAQVNYGSNFDPTLYANGGLAGQDGWAAGSGATNMPTVTNNFSFSSPQSVMLQGYPGTGSSFESDGHAFAAGAPSAATQILTASCMIRVDNIAGADRYFGIGFGTSALATNGFIGVALGGNGLRGGGGSYASYNSLATGQLQNRTLADFTGRWVYMSFRADRLSVTNNVTFTFAGLGTTGGSSVETFTKSVNFGTTNLTTAQIFSDWGSTSTVNGLAFIDNAKYGANAVPEPATMAALGLGVAALLRRRKKA
jgi:hypothetical protein